MIQPDGAKEATPQYFNAGFLNGDNTLSKDGKTIEGTGEFQLDDSQWSKFLVSLIEGEGNRLTEEAVMAEGLRSYNFLVGMRLQFKRIVDEEATKKLGKRVAKKGPHKGKEFNRYLLLCESVLGVPEAPKGAKKAGAAAKPAPAAKAAPAETVPTGTDAVDAALISILSAAADQTVERSKLGSAATKYSLAEKHDTPTREGLRKTLGTDDYINDAAERGLIVIDGDGKAAKLVLAIEIEEAA